MKTIQLNGKPQQTQATTLAMLLQEQGYDASSRIATAINGTFIAKSQRDSQSLQEGDQIEVVAPMQGG